MLLLRITYSKAIYTVLFFSLLTALHLFISRICYRDPGSVFFDPERAYLPHYSTVRLQQATAYIEQASLAAQPKCDLNEQPQMCVAMVSTARPSGVTYLDGAVGSLLDGLSPAERQEIHVILLIAHTNASIHAAHNATWIDSVVDTFLRYDGLPPSQLDKIKHLERLAADGAREKTRIDYTLLLEACQKTGASQVLILEDDVLAIDGWYHRSLAAAKEAYRRTRSMNFSEYLYIRLFWSEKHQGWNSEEWPIYARNIAAFIFIQLAILFTIRALLDRYPRFYPHRHELIANNKDEEQGPTPSAWHTRVRLPLMKWIMVFSIANAFLITGIFAAGRMSVFPHRRPIVPMPTYGCCTQGMLYPSTRVPTVLRYLRRQAELESKHETHPIWVDATIEKWANEEDELRWAIVPSVLQHVGAVSSTKSHSQFSYHKTFSFAFETMDAEQLRKEHQGVVDNGVGLH